MCMCVWGGGGGWVRACRCAGGCVHAFVCMRVRVRVYIVCLLLMLQCVRVCCMLADNASLLVSHHF